MFQNKQPMHTYVITVNSLMRVGDIINQLYDLLGLRDGTSRAVRLSNIIIKLRDIKRKGGSPQIIFDESENMDGQTMRMIKGLFDGIYEYASIVLIGTDQLIYKMEKAKNGNKEGGPQLYRRFKKGIKYLDDIDRKFVKVFETLEENGITIEAGLRKLLHDLCENYGELQNYLEPAIRECGEKGIRLTEEFFRLKYDIRK
jgi:DNA transposition AAA+ family ATPase